MCDVPCTPCACRYCAAPGSPAYTLVAKQDVKAGEALLDYIGQYRLGRDAQFKDVIEQVRPMLRGGLCWWRGPARQPAHSHHVVQGGDFCWTRLHLPC